MTISILLNVLNGAKTLMECLESVVKLADEVVAVIDTRTTDETPEILQEFQERCPDLPVNVSYFNWVDSFAEARNFALEKCQCDWIFQIDHDETLDPASISFIKDVVEKHPAVAIAHSILNKKANGVAWHPAVRLFRNGHAHYTRRKHNIPVFDEEGTGFFPHIVIHHTGYNLPPEEMTAKHQRDEYLILLELKDNPFSVFAHRSLIRNYRAMKAHDKVQEWADKLFAMSEAEGIEIGASTYQMVMLDLFGTYIDQDEYERAEGIGRELLDKHPDNIDGRFLMGTLYTTWEKYPECIVEYERYLELLQQQKLQPINNQIIIEHWGSEHMALNNMAWAHSQQGRHKKAARLLRNAIQAKPDYLPIRSAYQYELGCIPDGEPLNLLFVQNVTSSRNRKLARALRARGHKVTLAYTQENRFADESCYDEVIHVRTESELMELAPKYDLVHAMDTAGYFAVSLEEYTNCIVIRDIHDISELSNKTHYLWTISGLSARHADGLTFSTPQQLYKMHEIHGCDIANSMYIMNYASKDEAPNHKIPKLSGIYGEFHIVYEGYVGRESHIDMRDIFCRLAYHHIHVHIYSAVEHELYRRIATHSDYIHYHGRLPFDELIPELTQYDAGIVPWNLEKGSKEYLDSTIANKVFDYVLAGLPVITCNSRALAWYVEENEIGIAYDTVDDIVKGIEKLRTIDVSGKVEFMEDHIDELVGFYRMALWRKHKPYQPGISLDAADVIALEESDLDMAYDAYFSEDGKYTRMRIDRIVELAEGDVLDIGCAGGLIPILCARKGLKATGLDISPTSVMNALNNADKEQKEVRERLDFLCSDAQEGFDGRKFDTVIMGQVLEHVLDPDGVIENALMGMNDDGRLIATVPNGYLQDKKHLRHFDETSFRYMLEQHCSVMSIEHVGPRMLAICQHDRSDDNG